MFPMASASFVASSECRKICVDEGAVAALAAPSLHSRTEWIDKEWTDGVDVHMFVNIFQGATATLSV